MDCPGHIPGVACGKALSTGADGFPDVSCPAPAQDPCAVHCPGRDNLSSHPPPLRKEPQGRIKDFTKAPQSCGWDPDPLTSSSFPAREKAHDRLPCKEQGLPVGGGRRGSFLDKQKQAPFLLNNPVHSESREQGHSDPWAGLNGNIVP